MIQLAVVPQEHTSMWMRCGLMRMTFSQTVVTEYVGLARLGLVSVA
jgi:hypothetical protein